MPNQAQGQAGADEHTDRWRELVRRLHADLDVLVDDFVAQVQKIPPYGDGGVPMERVQRDAMLTFDHLCRLLAGLPAPPTLDDTAAEIGRDRARLRVPLDHLLRAVRLDFQVLWSNMQRLSGPADLPVLVDHVEQIWSVVEAYTTQVQFAYMAEAAILARETGMERSVLVARLLDAPTLDGADVERAAIALDINPKARCLVACAPTSRQSGLYCAFERALAVQRSAHWQDRGEQGLLIVEWKGDDELAISSILAGIHCGVGPVAQGLADLPRAVHVAQRVTELLEPDDQDPRRLRDVLARLVAVGLDDLRDEVATTVLGNICRVSEVERARLLEVIEAYLDCGSVQETATRLYCHRNTVLNRLSRFAAVTGYDVTKPKDSAAVYLALGCRQDLGRVM